MKLLLIGLAFAALAYAESPSAEYLPPNQDDHIEVAAPSNEYIAPAAEEHTVVGNDGYRYKTVRRLRTRVRRDVSELPNAEYLPPNQEAHVEIAAPSNEYIAPAAEEHTVVGNDGYRYKTVRRLRTRVRREAPSAEYLPPNQDAHVEIAAPSNEYIAPAAEEHTVVGNDGYRYKTVRRLRTRVRREAPSAEYLPPNQEAHVEIAAPSNEYIAPAAEEHTVVGNDGYRYKTVRRLRTRVRREAPSADYLPPGQDVEVAIDAPSNEYIAPAAAEQTVVANDGYRYKTVKKFKIRRH